MKRMRAPLVLIVALTLTCGVRGQTTQPAESDPADQDARRHAAQMTAAGAKYLIRTQEKEGGWAGQTGPGITCLVLKALVQEPTVPRDDAAIRRGITFVLRHQRDDGGVYSAEGLLKNYESSVALSLFAVLDEPRHARRIARLQQFLKDLQWDESEGKSLDDPWYGGAGYGHHQRPDLSNTQMMLEALHDSGLPENDPTYKKALVFIRRCQMLGESNDLALANGSSQGGFIYTCHNGGESKAGMITVDGRNELRCYGSMTYAGFKSMLYCGLSRRDPKVQAALDWIRSNWTLEHNPNMPQQQSQQGLFYYYHVFGRALDAWDERVIIDDRGRAHRWRVELVDALKGQQHDDGRWVNDADRWMEGLPPLTTAYSMLALQAAYPPSE